jgi:hypothetical protein
MLNNFMRSSIRTASSDNTHHNTSIKFGDEFSPSAEYPVVKESPKRPTSTPTTVVEPCITKRWKAGVRGDAGGESHIVFEEAVKPKSSKLERALPNSRPRGLSCGGGVSQIVFGGNDILQPQDGKTQIRMVDQSLRTGEKTSVFQQRGQSQIVFG